MASRHRSRKHSTRRKRRGGRMGLAKTLTKAAVPFGLLALQKHMSKRKRSKKRSRSSKRR